MSSINQIVDKVYVINLDKDKERMNHMDKQCKQHQIDYVRFPAVVGAKVEKDARLSPFCQQFCTDGAKGCALSHHGIWEDMIKQNINSALILEDDGVFSNDFDFKVESAMRSIPQPFDIVYLTTAYNPNNETVVSQLAHTVAGVNPQEHTPLLKKTKGGFGTAAYIIHIDFVRKILDKPITQHIDYQLTKWIQELDAQAYSFTDYAVHTDTGDFESNLAETFPKGINSILKQIKVHDAPDFSWILNENIIKLGPFNMNVLLVLVMLGVAVTPQRFIYGWFVWLLIEGLIAMDIKNTLRYGVFMGLVVLLRSKLG